MKWFTKNHSYWLAFLVAAFGGAMFFVGVTQEVWAYDDHRDNNDNNGHSDYNRDYSDGRHNHDYNNCSGSWCGSYQNSNQQYYISPYITSTQPYYVAPNYQNYYYSDHNYYGRDSFSVSCSPNKSYAMQGEPVTWAVHIFGGRSYNYSYSWSGTDNPLSLNAGSINVSYGSVGIKNMNVTVWSDGRSVNVYCGSVSVGQYQNYYYGPQPYQYPYVY